MREIHTTGSFKKVTGRKWVERLKGGNNSFQLGRLEKYSPVKSKVSWIYTRNIVLQKRMKYLLGWEKLEYPKKLSRRIIKSFKTKLAASS